MNSNNNNNVLLSNNIGYSNNNINNNNNININSKVTSNSNTNNNYRKPFKPNFGKDKMVSSNLDDYKVGKYKDIKPNMDNKTISDNTYKISKPIVNKPISTKKEPLNYGTTSKTKGNYGVTSNQKTTMPSYSNHYEEVEDKRPAISKNVTNYNNFE